MKRPKLRRLFRFALYGLGAFLLGLALLVVFQHALLRRFALPELERLAGKALGLSVTVSDVVMDSPGSLTVVGFEAKGPSPRTGVEHVSFDRASISVSALGLFRGKKDWLKKVRLEAPRLRLDLDHDPLLFSFGGEGTPGPEAKSMPPLPKVELIAGELEIKTEGKNLKLQGVSASLDGLDLTIRVQGASGRWTIPRWSAMEFPLEVGARLADGPDPLERVLVNHLSMGTSRIVKEARLDLSTPGVVRFSGELPAWGAIVSSGQITSGTLDIQAHAEETPISRIVALFTDWPCPLGRGTGNFHLVLPLEKVEDWQVESDMEIEGAVWEEEEIRAERLRETVHRGADLILHGEVFAEGLELKSSAAMDCMGSFRREPSGKDDSRIIVDEAACYRGGVAFSLSGALRESDLFLENGFLRMAPSPVSAWKSLEPLLDSWRGDVAARVFFDGHVEDPASYQACGWFTGKGIRPPTMETGVDVFLESSLARCQARVGQGRVSVCDGGDDQVYFAVSTDITLPLEARFSRLDGQVGGFPFQAAGTGEVVVDEATARLEPTLLQVLGGQMEIAGEGSSAGIYALQLLASDLRLSKILGAYLPDLQPEGIVSCRASLLGSSGQRPDFEGEIALRDGALTVGGKKLLGIDADAKVTAQGETIQLEPLRIRRGKDRIEVFAKGPAPWRSSSPGEELLEASFRADLAEIADLPFPEGQLRDAGGQLALEGTLRGPWTGDESLFPSMDLDAKVKVSNGKLKLYGDIPPLVNIQAELALKNDQVLVRSFTGRLWDADFHISGQARLTLPGREAAPSIHSVDLALLARSALLFRRPELRVRGDLDLRWKGLWERSLLEGDLNVTRAYYLQDVSMTPSRGARLPLQLFSLKGPPFEAMRFNVRVKSNRGLIIKNNLISTRATTDLLLGGTGLEPALTGTLSTDEGKVSFGNAKLEIKNSLVEFLPSDPLNPRLQVVLGDTVRGFVVTITITGTLDAPEVLMDSSPPLEREKILVLITTGLTLEEIEKQGVDRVAATQAALYVGKRIARYLSTGDPTEKSFLDRFSLETESAQSARYEDPIRIEYRIKEDLLLKKDELFLQGERDAFGDYNFNLGIRFEMD